MKVLIPDSLPLNFPHIDPTIELITYSANGNSFADNKDAEMLVMWNNSAENTASAVADLENLKLVQTLSAGPDHAVNAGFRLDIPIASGRGLHDATVVEHALALFLAEIRQLHRLKKSQENHLWDSDYISSQANPETASRYTVLKQEILIYGFGSIAAQLAPILKSLGAHVTGVARHQGVRGEFPVVTPAEALTTLKNYSVVISMLPFSPETSQFFGKEFFSALNSDSIFINVGRGKTVDESALFTALESGKLRSASIDVTSVEPLPSDSPLWECNNLTITPHIAGGRPRGGEELILANARALIEGSPLHNLV